MKKTLSTIILAAAAVAAVAPQAGATDLREHRAMFVTPYLSDWPTSAITKSNVNTHLRILRKNLDNFKAQGINVLYYHVRSMCDATYRSEYEPWSKGVSGTRGVEPAIDPLETIIAESHERGIEVYAWINPYRYEGVYAHADTPLNYSNTHPDWLIVQSGKESILNPGLPEVQQRICDVVADIMGKYDIDGVIFDDYFYTSPTPMTLDADLYEAAKAADPSVGTQIEWRANNVNTMVRRVNQTIKSIRPHVVFGISPAGVASPSFTKTKYGLEPYAGDWQYNSIASDPLDWYMNHYVDFMAPQIYWPTKFDELESWWNTAARKFGRHLYSAITLSDYNTYKAEEYDREVDFARATIAQNESGLSFFTYATFVNNNTRVDGVLTSFGDYLGMNSFNAKALTPLRPWNNVYSPEMTANIHRDGTTLVWDATPAGRYTVYAFASGEKPSTSSSNFLQACYTNSIEIPEGLEGYTFGVCVYDRFGNEYSMLTEGATVGEPVVATLTYPASGEAAAPLFDFTWDSKGASDVVEVSADPDFKELLAMVPATDGALSAFSVPSLTDGVTYYWRVRSHGVNAPAGLSRVQSFVTSRITVTGNRTNVSTTPRVEWTAAYEGSQYLVEISRNANFATLDFEGTTTEPFIDVPAGHLTSGFNYYVRVTATRGGRSAVSDVARLSTADIEYEAPAFANPLTPGATVHSNEAIEVDSWQGMSSITIGISASETFPARTSYKVTLKDGETATPALSDIKVNSKALVDGTTYYVRVCSNYFLLSNASTEQHSDYRVSSFVYSAEAGVGSVVADSDDTTISSEGILTMPCAGHDVDVYTPSGTLVYSAKKAPASVSLEHLDGGLYIIRTTGPAPATLKWKK